MRTASQQAALTAPNAKALHDALERIPAEVLDEEQAARRRSRMRILRRHAPRHAAPAGSTETDADADTAVMEFREMRQDEPVPPAAPIGRIWTGPQPAAAARAPRPHRGAVLPTGPQPRFIPAGRHRSTETEQILTAARRRADAVPVPPPPAEHPVTAAQAWQSLHRLRYPAPDSRDAYGNTPAYVAMMRVADILTGTTSRYGYAAAHPVPVAPLVSRRGMAVTPGDEASHRMPAIPARTEGPWAS